VQAFAPDQVARLAKLKKVQIASEAERLAAGTGWLPAMLRAPEPVEATDAASSSEARAEAQADAEEQEDAHAAA